MSVTQATVHIPQMVMLWFRLDLRLDDNLALHEAIKTGSTIIPVYIHDSKSEGEWRHGAVSQWWLNQSLKKLSEKFHSYGSKLIFRKGDSLTELQLLLRETGARTIFWNRRYEPALIQRDQNIQRILKKQGVEVQTFNSSLLNEPWHIQTGSKTPFRVFTPYWNKCIKTEKVFEPVSVPSKMIAPKNWPKSCSLKDFKLLPKIHWYRQIEKNWTPGEVGARSELESFLNKKVIYYLNGRDIPSVQATSRLSPHLHFGEISPRRILNEVQKKSAQAQSSGRIRQMEGFIRQLYWREFAYHLLYHFPEVIDHPLRKEFEKFEWKKDTKSLQAWQKGQTGYPLVDAGMRELWSTGWMHGRVRMIVASFLIKDLLIHWMEGARWFWDTLVDADLANNSFGWQWIAGCGADAAPYFRIFNPVTQSKKFDKEGVYIRRWVPELAKLPDEWVHCPWEAPTAILKKAGIIIGKNYPKPLVDHSDARKKALFLYDRFKCRVQTGGER